MGLSGENTASNYRPDVEGLRAVAVLLVVAFHVGVAGASGGFIGVDVFFVLSGYLITQLLMREHEKTGTIDFVRFYARRSRRLLPAAALMLSATVVASYLLFSPIEQRDLSGTAAATGAYLSNVWFARNATDYLGAGGDTNPLLHTWSLAVEEQFYIFWPTIMLLVLRFARGRKGVVAVGMIVIAMLSMVVSLRVMRTATPWAFFGSPTRAWEFAVGALASLIVLETNARNRWVASVLCVVGLVAIISASYLFTRATAFPGTAALLPVIGTAAVLVGATANPSHIVLRPLSTSPMQFLGKLSYSWYLWHWPVLVLGAIYIGRTPSISARIAFATVALGIAWITHVVLENPVRYSRWLGARDVGRDLALTRILDLRPKFVVMSNATQYLRANDDRLRVTANEWRDAEAQTLHRLSAASIPAFVVRDSPIPGFDVPTCASRLAWRSTSNGQCDAARSIAVENVAADAEAEAVTSSGTARLIDLTDAICGKTVCPAKKDGRLVYRDDHHLTASFVSYLAPLVIKRMGIRDQSSREP